MFTPIPMFKVADPSGLASWPSYLLVEAADDSIWFIARIVVGSSLKVHTMLFSDIDALLNTLAGPEFKRCASLWLVVAKGMRLEVGEVSKLWRTNPGEEREAFAALRDGRLVDVHTGVQVRSRSDLRLCLDVGLD